MSGSTHSAVLIMSRSLWLVALVVFPTLGFTPRTETVQSPAEPRRARAEPWRTSRESASLAASPAQVTAIRAGARSSDPPRNAGASWPQSTLSTVVSPVFSDLDGDGIAEVIAADDRFVYVYDVKGGIRSGWPRDVGGANEHAAVADIDDDGIPEILIGTNFPGARLWALTPAGATKPGWPVDLPFVSLVNTSCPVVADLIPGGNLEVGIASERGVSFFNAQGQSIFGWPYLWPVPVNNPQWSAPAVCDLDDNGSLEVVVGNVNFPDWGVHVILANGMPMPGWPKVINPVLSSPAVADLDHDGDLEIIVQEGDPGTQGNRMWVWHHNGTVLSGWPRVIAANGNSSRCSPAVADLDDDGTLDIVTVTGDGLMHIFTPDAVEHAGWATGGVQPIASPAVVDVDGDGIEEVFLSYWLAQQQFVAGWHPNGSLLPGFPALIFSPTDLNSHASPHVADPDASGDFELAIAGSSQSQGRVWVIGINPSVVGPNTRGDWPKIRRDLENTGCFAGGTPLAVGPAAAPAFGLRVFPNPVAAGGRLQVWTPAGESGRLIVRDVQGRTLSSRALGAGVAPELLSVSLLVGAREPASGVYFLSFEPESGNRASSSRFVIRR